MPQGLSTYQSQNASSTVHRMSLVSLMTAAMYDTNFDEWATGAVHTNLAT